MITINANLREPIFLRHAGEENALRVAFDLQEFEAHWPGGVPALLVRRPISSMDAAAYPVPLSVDGMTAFWTVSASDTEYSGYGKAQLQWRVGGTLAKSCVYDTVCAPSLIAGDAPPDAPSKAWFEAIQGQIGDLSKLTTKAKENLVAAINEAARTGGGSGGGKIEMRVSGGYIQYSNDGVTWENLIAVSDLKGDKGETGPKGENGSDATVTKEAIESALGFAPIGANDVPIRTVNGATGEVKSTYYVSITQGNGVFAVADKSAQAVYDAYAAGYAVYARVQFQGVAAPFVLPLVAASKSGSTIKLGFGAIGSISRDNPPQYPTVAYTGEAWAAWLGTLARASDIPSIPLSLPNPNALNIKIGDTTTSYDGSEAKTVEIPAASRDDLSLGITGAQVGQIAKITAVDAQGKPTAWSPVDLAGGGLTDAQIAALDGLFKIASYQQDSSAAYEAFKQAFGIADGVIVFAADFSGSSPSAAQFYSWAGRVYGSAIYDALTNIQCVDGAVMLTSVYDSTNSRWVKQMMCTGGLFEADEFICTFKAKFCGTAGSWNSVITYGAGTHWTDGLYSDGIKWPAGGEIDAFEQAGGYAENPNTFKTPTAHWGSGRNSQYPDTHLSRTGESVAFTPDVWHNFKFSLKSGTVRIYIDDTLVGEKDFSDCAVSNNYLADYKPFLKPQAFYIDGSCADTSDTSNSYLFEVKDFKVYQDADVACTGLAIHPQMWANGTTLVFPVGAEIYFDRVYTPANTSNKACVWESTNEDVATVEQGYVKTLATGTTVIRATCGGVTATYTLTVAASASIPCAKLACAQESIIANAGNAIALNVYKYPSFATDEISVTSGSQDVCTVSGTIVTAVGAGSTEITIQCGTKSVTIPVTVSAAKSPYVAYDFAELAANIGQPRTDENASVAVANTGTAGAAFDLTATARTKDVIVDNAWVTQIDYYTAQNSPLETALNLRTQPFLYVVEVRENNGYIYLNGTNVNVMPSIVYKANVCYIRYGPVDICEYTPAKPPYGVAIYFDGAKTSVFANAAKIASDGGYAYITGALKYFKFGEPERINAFKLYVGDTFTDDEIIALTEAQNG